MPGLHWLRARPAQHVPPDGPLPHGRNDQAVQLLRHQRIVTWLRARRRRRQTRAEAELVLAVAEVFPHEFGQQLWWESYQRRTPRLQRELVDDLHRRQTRNRAART